MSDQTAPVELQLDPNEILIAEFEYIAKAAFQANEDRARVSNYYLVTAGAAVAAVVGAKLEGTTPEGVYWGFAAVFGVLSVVGWLTVLQLARLRSAWIESIRALNVIKDHYSTHCQGADLPRAFAWNVKTIPVADKRSSIAFLLATSVVLVDAVTAGAAVVYAGLALGSPQGDALWLVGGGLIGLAFAIMQYRWYFSLLKAK